MVRLRSIAHDRERQVTVEASLDSKLTLGEALKNVHQLPAFESMPEVDPRATSRRRRNSARCIQRFRYSYRSCRASDLCSARCSFRQFPPSTHYHDVAPFIPCGALIGLVMFNQSIGLYALIGLVMLMGLVTKNAILLVEYALVQMQHGCPDARLSSPPGKHACAQSL